MHAPATEPVTELEVMTFMAVVVAIADLYATEHTWSEIAVILGLSEARVKKIGKRALFKMRRSLVQGGVTHKLVRSHWRDRDVEESRQFHSLLALSESSHG